MNQDNKLTAEEIKQLAVKVCANNSELYGYTLGYLQAEAIATQQLAEANKEIERLQSELTQLKAERGVVDELLEALNEIIKTCNPKDVTPNKVFMGFHLGKYYVGTCGIPSNKAIHLAVNAIKKYNEPHLTPQLKASKEVSDEEIRIYANSTNDSEKEKLFFEIGAKWMRSKQSHLTPKESDAVEFAEWLSENASSTLESNIWLGLDLETKTTQELYSIFKQSKTKG